MIKIISSIYSKLTNLLQIKRSIKKAIEDRGGTVSGGIETYASAIDALTEETEVGRHFYLSCATNITQVPVELLTNLSNMATLNHTFYDCSNLTSFPDFDSRKLKYCNYTFEYCTRLTDINLDLFKNTLNLDWCFCDASNIPVPTYLNFPKITSMQNTFAYNVNTTSLTLDAPNVRNLQGCFYQNERLFSLNLEKCTQVTNLNSAFARCYSLIRLKLPNLSKITKFDNVFNSCSNLTELDLTTLNPNIRTLNGLFEDCTNLVRVNFPSYNLDKVTSVRGMISSCYKLLINFLSKIPNVEYAGDFIYDCRNIQNLDFSSWEKVTNLGIQRCLDLSTLSLGNKPFLQSLLISSCSKLQTLYISSFGSELTNLSFIYCSKLEYNSIMNIINALPTTSGTLALGTTNLNKLSDSDKAIATNKGWTLS